MHNDQQRGVHTTQQTLQQPGNPQPAHFSAFRMRLTHSAVVSKAYVRCREAIVEGSKLITGRFGNAAVRCHALDALSIRAVAVCVPLLLCAGWRQRTDCVVPSLLLKTGINTLTLARPREQVRQSALHGKKKTAATLFMVTGWRQYQYRPLLLGAGCRWIALISCSPPIYHIDFSDIKNNTSYKFSIWGEFPPSHYVTQRAYHL